MSKSGICVFYYTPFLLSLPPKYLGLRIVWQLYKQVYNLVEQEPAPSVDVFFFDKVCIQTFGTTVI